MISLEEEIGRAENRFKETKPDVAESDILEVAVGYVTDANQDFAKAKYASQIKRQMPSMLSKTYSRGLQKGQRFGLIYYLQNGNEVKDIVPLMDSEKQQLKLTSAEMSNIFTTYY